MNDQINILCIEDDESDYTLVARILDKSRFNIVHKRIQSENDFRHALEQANLDLVICDHTMPGFNSLKALEILREVHQDLPFIIVSGTIGEEVAVDAMLQGADDYILKDNMKRLLSAVEREVEKFQLKKAQRQDKKRLIISELKYSFLAESIQEVFFAFDADLILTYWNQTAKSIFKIENVIGRHIREVFPSWYHNGVIDLFLEALELNISKPVAFNHKLGRMEFFKGDIFPSMDGGTVLLRMVTEEKQNAEEMMKLNTELETLLYRISHDLKGPVASVMGLLNLLQKDPDFDLKKFIYMMSTNMKRLDQTLVRLLNITKVKAGSENLARMNVFSELQEIIDALVFLEGFENIKIKLDLDKSLEIYCDPSIFSCVWQNLLENAIKYRQVGRVNQVTIQASENKTGLSFCITDTGQGIDPLVHRNIFDMFFRGNEESDGSGLGLYIVKNALNKINGTIRIDKSYSKGAKFHIYIPQFIKSKMNEDEKQLYDYRR
ncbi:response regulator [Fulvivirga sp. M361]|uniref:ATP-binding response regulator n=1 Tax=Fulvivirga sp. M361 TaxID=2594266 RepID=UPI00117AB5D7|nr:hybrid sensor histidine kinase/response regulator [Fulvivirga sp. M361]TRX47194.1 response regulator [Fulvivirga sp. M361]